MTGKEFLLAHGQSAENIDIQSSLRNFWQQMQLGLEGNGGMPMIPTYLMNIDRSKIKLNEKHIIIDAGGTNFRCALGYFDDQGQVVIERQKKTIMPASDRLLTKSEFYGTIASNIARLLPAGKNVGFCFSYQVDMNADLDGKVVMFSKEVKAPEVIGTQVGKETLSACKQYDKTKRKIVILNDTVATLLGGLALNDEKFGAYLGYIYGTGTNVCYIEDTSKITKVNGLPAGKMLINTECGNFDGFAQGDFDKITIARTAVPDKQLFEKMTSGKYLADIIYEALSVAERNGLFAGKTDIVPFTLKDVSTFLTDNNFCGLFEDEQDMQFVREICVELIRRSAKMGAIVNSALAIASCQDKSLPVAIVAEGTTFNKLPHYREFFEQYLTEILGAWGLKYKILQGEDLNMVGTLMATMVL
ncbi:MAG: hypothetical protein J1G02_05595 [Clostridiales bacterium]|nr:hypothetical protein [Clostridiales bacterium]